MDYVEQGVAKYTEQLRQRELYALTRLAKKYNYVVLEYKSLT